MIKVTFNNKISEQFENYGEVLEWVSEELSFNSTSELSTNKVKLEVLTKEAVEHLASDKNINELWSPLLDRMNNKGHEYAVVNADTRILGTFTNFQFIEKCDLETCLEEAGILNLFNICEEEQKGNIMKLEEIIKTLNLTQKQQDFLFDCEAVYGRTETVEEAKNRLENLEEPEEMRYYHKQTLEGLARELAWLDLVSLEINLPEWIAKHIDFKAMGEELGETDDYMQCKNGVIRMM